MQHFGKVAKCKHGKIGVVTSITYYEDGHQVLGWMSEKTKDRLDKIYHGVALDGSKWQSKDPTILANSVNEYISETTGY